ncbi:ribbon-helix-helix protein, CopG family [Synechococcus sp. BIOS-E4-1]|uniref:plasmid mobilization protein n=1 Tax=Synechococcus sp. BIOS-E4-1 TaxID=1400864 RepID=UPI0016458D88|nr:ribbon-helix-helix protein, CopG family [Synechococcus sp. BIOS-E4-1]
MNKESTLNVRVPGDYKDQIAEVAKQAGISPSEFVRRSLRHSLEMVELTQRGQRQ